MVKQWQRLFKFLNLHPDGTRHAWITDQNPHRGQQSPRCEFDYCMCLPEICGRCGQLRWLYDGVNEVR